MKPSTDDTVIAPDALTVDELNEARDLVDWLRCDYEHVRMLPDGSVAACSRLTFTTAIYLGMNRMGWTQRFCFEDRQLALQRYVELQSEDDEPQGFIARRGG